MKRFSTLILILVLSLAFSTSAFAQEEQVCPPGLTEEDCDLLYASTEAMQDVSSGTSFVGVEMDAINLPQSPYRDLSFDFTLDTTYDYSDEAMALSQELQGMDAQALADLYANPTELANTLSTLLTGTSAEMTMMATFSEELAALFTADPAMAFPQNVILNLVLYQGILYVDLSTLEPLMGEQAMPMTGWVGVELAPLVTQSITQTTTTPAGTTGAFAGTTINLGAGPLFPQLTAADPAGTLTNFLNIERMEDAAVGVEDVAVFETTVNWDAFVESPYFEQLVANMLYQQAATTGTVPTQAEIDQFVTLGRMFGPAVLEGIAISLTEQVGLETDYLLSTELVLDWDLSDLANLSTMAGGAALDVEEDSQFYISIVTTNSGLNETVDIDAPANAFVVPAAMLNQMMTGQAPAQ